MRCRRRGWPRCSASAWSRWKPAAAASPLRSAHCDKSRRMSFDLIVHNATLPDGRTGLDIGVAGGKIAAVERAIVADAARVIDTQGCLVSPPFVDVHFHMYATLSLGLPRLNQSGTLLEGIALWGELRPQLTVQAVVERALRYCDRAGSQGLLAVRSHVDVSDERRVTVEGLSLP